MKKLFMLSAILFGSIGFVSAQNGARTKSSSKTVQQKVPTTPAEKKTVAADKKSAVTETMTERRTRIAMANKDKSNKSKKAAVSPNVNNAAVTELTTQNFDAKKTKGVN
jgi:hypothetical protein